MANLDADYHQQPKSWVIAIDDSNTNQKRLRIEDLWSGSKMRWVRDHVVTKAGNPKGSNRLDIETWYNICQKVRAIKRKEGAERYRPRSVHWVEATKQIAEERPGANKEEVRQLLRARILHMVDQFTADILATTEVQRARMMAAYRQWDENTLKSAIDPNWDQHSFFERAYTDNHLMDWAHQITTHIDQRYICRKVGCQAVIDNKHWLRKISPDVTIASQHGKYIAPTASGITAPGSRSPAWSLHKRPSSSQ